MKSKFYERSVGVDVQSIRSKLIMNHMTNMRESQMKTLNITIKFNLKYYH
jgi:hypothetical protein